MRRVLGLLSVVALMMPLAAPARGAQPEGFAVVSEQATYVPSSGQVRFHVVFNRVPDFYTTDEFDRPADSFQYYIVGDATLPYPQNYDAIIRGVEVRYTDGLIPIRDGYPGIGPAARTGGWGAIRGEVPYELHGRVLSFWTPLAFITDQAAPRTIEYELGTFTFGAGGFGEYLTHGTIIVR